MPMNLTPNLKQRLLAWLDDGAGTNLREVTGLSRSREVFLIDKNGSVAWNFADLKSGGDAFSPVEHPPSFRPVIDRITNRQGRD